MFLFTEKNQQQKLQKKNINNMIFFQKILIPYNLINDDIEKNIELKLKLMNFKKCSFQYGYITEIVKIIKIGDNLIDPVSSNVIFEVLFEADTVKPEKDRCFVGKVCSIKHDQPELGVLVDVQNLFKINIIQSYMKNFRYDKASCSFVNATNESAKEFVKEGTELEIRILMLQYENKHFKCMGQLERVC